MTGLLFTRQQGWQPLKLDAMPASTVCANLSGGPTHGRTDRHLDVAVAIGVSSMRTAPDCGLDKHASSDDSLSLPFEAPLRGRKATRQQPVRSTSEARSAARQERCLAAICEAGARLEDSRHGSLQGRSGVWQERWGIRTRRERCEARRLRGSTARQELCTADALRGRHAGEAGTPARQR